MTRHETPDYTVNLADTGSADIATVGGKNASLGEMLRHLGNAGINVPDGFATTARAFREFLSANNLSGEIADKIEAFRKADITLEQAGRDIRRAIQKAEFPGALRDAIERSYSELGERSGRRDPSVAVRSSATAEDLPEASFAGQQESFLNITGAPALLDACRRCFASLFTDRAIAYRENNGFDHMKVALSAGIQTMVRSDKAGSGVMFSIDTETGFPDAVLINAAWGLGESVVQGLVDPDEYMVFKPCLNDENYIPVIEKKLGAKEKKIVYAGGGKAPTRTTRTSRRERDRHVLEDGELLQLARWATAIEAHYERPMDMEWAKDGETGELYVVQARPETVQTRRKTGALRKYRLKNHGRKLTSGLSIGDAIAAGKVCRLADASEIGRFERGSVLVTTMTDPDWVPIMKRAAAIVTDHGGRTSHAAIVSRELGLPALVGTGDATGSLQDGQEVTVSCAEGDEGFVYEGIADYDVQDLSLDEIPSTRTRIMLNVANPAAALQWWRLPADGIGLARMEFIINNIIKVHPMALAQWEQLTDRKLRRRIDELTTGWDDKAAFFVDNLAYGIARIAASQYPHPVIVRMSDFKTNEYADLEGGELYEPREPNPMIGWRGASRYYSEEYHQGFALECRAILKAREVIGLDNVIIMIPFCRTPEEADRVLEVLADNGLTRGVNGLQVYMMVEIPSNIVLAAQFAQRFDGFSIGSNDLTQLMLGVDRDSDRLAHLFNESSEAVTTVISWLIDTAHRHRCKVGLCGQAPSDHPEFARFLVEAGIDSISVNPDSFLTVKQQVAESEAESSAARQ